MEKYKTIKINAETHTILKNFAKEKGFKIEFIADIIIKKHLNKKKDK